MLSYPIDEAETLLQSKLDTAQKSLDNCEEDLDFLREQITVCAYTWKPCLPRTLLTLRTRPWRWPLPVSTTGRLCRSAKTRRMRLRTSRKPRRTRAPLMIDVFMTVRWGRLGLSSYAKSEKKRKNHENKQKPRIPISS